MDKFWLTICIIATAIALEGQNSREVAQVNLAPPPEAGVYYLNQGTWTPLSHVLARGKRPKSTFRILIPTLLPPIVAIFPGSEAPVSLNDVKPTFYVRDPESKKATPIGSSRDVLLVRLDRKKNHRELRISSGATIFNWGRNVPKDRIVDIAVKQTSNESFTLTPSDSLAPGEYMITFGTAEYGGYDFHVGGATAMKAHNTR